jgi:biofilm PGA synthesis protein PgaA
VTAVHRHLLTFLAVPVFLFLSTSGYSLPSDADAAMALAKAGQPDEAVRRLRMLLKSATADPAVALDLAALLQQTGKAAQAVSLFEKSDLSRAPGYALLAAVRAWRDLKDFARAAALARQGLMRFPQESVWPILLALILADDGKAQEALSLLALPAARAAPESDYLLAQAYAERRAGHPFDALRHYLALLTRQPPNGEARDAAVAILLEIRAPWAAARLAGEPPPLAIAADMAAAEIRWGPLESSRDPHHRFDETDRALGDLDRLIARAEGDHALLGRLRLDRMVALRDRVRMTEVISEAEALHAAGVTLPSYAREALADALLYMRRPEDARAEYDAVLAADPGNRDARAGRFYASVEMEDFTTAYAEADALLEKQPVWRGYRDGAGRYPDDDFVDALLRAALAGFMAASPAKPGSASHRSATPHPPIPSSCWPRPPS